MSTHRNPPSQLPSCPSTRCTAQMPPPSLGGPGRAPSLRVCAPVTQQSPSPSNPEKPLLPGHCGKLPLPLAASVHKASTRAETSPTCHPTLPPWVWGKFPCGTAAEGGESQSHSKGQQGVQAWGLEGPESHFLGRVSPSPSLSSTSPPPPSSRWRCKTKKVPLSRLHNSASQQRPIFKS